MNAKQASPRWKKTRTAAIIFLGLAVLASVVALLVSANYLRVNWWFLPVYFGFSAIAFAIKARYQFGVEKRREANGE